MPQIIQVLTTTADEAEAGRLSDALLERRLAACVQISGPISSRYRWQGSLETSQEWQCKIKTLESAYPAVEELIRTLHSYDEPQIVALPVLAASRGYHDWVVEEVDA